LGADAIGEIVKPIIREIKYGVAHRAHASTGICHASGGVPEDEVGGSGINVIPDPE
jgi:hypothetical protein